MGIIDPEDKTIGVHLSLVAMILIVITLSLSLSPLPSFVCQSVNNRSLSVGHICMSPVLCRLIKLAIAPLTVQSMAAPLRFCEVTYTCVVLVVSWCFCDV